MGTQVSAEVRSSPPGAGRFATADDALRPPLKWAGGKRWLVPQLESLWSQSRARRLVEPFCGGLAVALGLRPQRALLNDINPHPVNFYQWLQKGLRIHLEMRNDRDLYYQHRASFNELILRGRRQNRKSAELFYYLNRTGYNGLCRFNRKGIFNVPYGQYKTINYRQDFTPYRETLSSWGFQHADFETIEVRKSDFIYADPPYDVEFRDYSALGFAWEEQVRLAEWLCRHRGPAVLSNQATPRIVRLYRRLGYRLRFLEAPRMISCTGDRAPAREVLALRNL